MNLLRHLIAAAVAWASFESPGVAQQTTGSAAAPASRSGAWIINGSEHFCSIGRTTQDPVPITFSLRIVPGTGSAELLLISPSWNTVPLKDGKEVEIFVGEGGTRYLHAPRAGRLRNRDPIVAFLSLPRDFIDAFTAGSQVRIVEDGQTRIQFSYRQADRAVRAMQECVRYTLEQWGVDQAAWANFSQGPTLVRPWLTASDYPPAELMQGLDGGVTIALSIDPSGSITRCRVVSASGHRGFDRAACAKARGPGFFRPALNQSGEAVAADIVQRIRFQIQF